MGLSGVRYGAGRGCGGQTRPPAHPSTAHSLGWRGASLGEINRHANQATQGRVRHANQATQGRFRHAHQATQERVRHAHQAILGRVRHTHQATQVI